MVVGLKFECMAPLCLNPDSAPAKIYTYICSFSEFWFSDLLSAIRWMLSSISLCNRGSRYNWSLDVEHTELTNNVCPQEARRIVLEIMSTKQQSSTSISWEDTPAERDVTRPWKLANNMISTGFAAWNIITTKSRPSHSNNSCRAESRAGTASKAF